MENVTDCLELESPDDNIKINFSKHKIRVREKARGKMKIYVDLPSDEAEAFKGLQETVAPPGTSVSDFARFLFFRGLEVTLDNLRSEAEAKMLENPELADEIFANAVEAGELTEEEAVAAREAMSQASSEPEETENVPVTPSE